MPNKYLQIDGVATFVHHTGPTTLPDAPPVFGAGETLLCLHGEGAHGGFFADLFRALEERHGLISFDQPGHGRSGSLDSLGSIEHMSAFSGAFCDKLGLEGVVALGHGMGAAVALQLALERPATIRGLVLCGAGARIPYDEAALAFARRVSEGKEKRPFDPTLFAKGTSPDVMRRTFMEGMKTDPRATYGDLLACSAWDDTARLAEIDVPALILTGEGEKDEVREQAATLAEALPNARAQTIPSAGHALLFEAPEALAEAIDAFLGDLGGARR